MLDAVVYTGALLVATIGSAIFPETTILLQVLFGGLLFVVFFYEPLLVWRTGGTLGHRWANLRVVDNRTHHRPGFWRALARFWIKAWLGPVSFLLMSTTRRRQAAHDYLTNTSVQMRDLGIALPHHYVVGAA
jgi:uncharacterized RDD family membrane protein YckC